MMIHECTQTISMDIRPFVFSLMLLRAWMLIKFTLNLVCLHLLLHLCQISVWLDYALAFNLCDKINKIFYQQPKVKNEVNTLKVWPPISHEWLMKIQGNLLCDVPKVVGSYYAKKNCMLWEGILKLYMCENCTKIVFCFSFNFKLMVLWAGLFFFLSRWHVI